MRTSWQEQPERGSHLLMRFITWLSLSAGRPVGRFLLYPICAYFFIFSETTRNSSREYLSTLFGQRASLWQVYRHYHTFSCVILDRPFMLSGQLNKFDIAIKGEQLFNSELIKEKGCLLLGAHLGSFDALRALGQIDRGLPIKIMMYADNSERIMALMNAINPAIAKEVISLGRPDAMLRARQHLKHGGMIGLLGDRITRGDKLVRTTFLDRPAAFPAGPMLLAGILNVPVVFFCGLYRGGNRYDIYFELFAEKVVIDRRTRQEDLQVWINRYAQRIEHYCRLAPYNWFNFYKFWGS